VVLAKMKSDKKISGATLRIPLPLSLTCNILTSAVIGPSGRKTGN
jgi:hypothetical protein